MQTGKGTYTISIPIELYQELRELADSQNKNIDEVLQSAIKWQFILSGILKDQGEILVKYKDSQSLRPIKF